VAGGVQGRSGTGFDPSPQFWVDRVESDHGALAVVGRCFFGPVRTGLVFDGIVSARDGAWLLSDLVTCHLQVAEIHVLRRPAGEIDQMLSGRLALSGQVPAGLGYNSLLVSSGSPDDGWMLRDGLWARQVTSGDPASAAG
jgi:hypothetical protein